MNIHPQLYTLLDDVGGMARKKRRLISGLNAIM